jgi:putative DNA primase/helicase
MNIMRTADIHACVAWPRVLAQLGIPESALRNKHSPCPACGGKDRFRFVSD